MGRPLSDLEFGRHTRQTHATLQPRACTAHGAIRSCARSGRVGRHPPPQRDRALHDDFCATVPTKLPKKKVGVW